MSDLATDNLADALQRYEIELPTDQIEQLDRYRSVLWRENEKLNLTRHTTFEKFVTRDVVDSLALTRLLDIGESVLDLGTGGGVPGLILAIVRPDLRVTACDSVAKRARATAEIAAEIASPAQVLHASAQSLLESRRFDTIVVRAVAPLRKLLTWLQPHWDVFDQLLLIKGKNWVQERGEARHLGLLGDLQLRRVHTYETPGSGAENVVLRVCPRQDGHADEDLETE
ncbi:MAG: 16S rRNA (guanine(527)-N(7))-methyltransferase RsmG [Planctomycetales bacterium]|nr:16S rRNA (guanine(527)-N(7))-methyltransferase RsmG [Planctomycetales bacterium]